MSHARRRALVSVQFQDRSLAVGAADIRRAARAARAFAAKGPAALSVVVVADEVMRRLNRTYAGVASTTDVLAFDLSGGPATPDSRAVGARRASRRSPVEAEVIVNAAVAAAQAARRRRRPVEELLLYVVHGVLHLGGYRDHTAHEKRLMRAAEAEVMKTLSKGS